MTFAVNIVNKDNTVISFFRTDEQDIKLVKNDENFIEIEIPSLHFRGGEYFIDLYCSRGRPSFENILDKIPRAFSFEVLTQDILNIGKPLLIGQISFMKYKFK